MNFYQDFIVLGNGFFHLFELKNIRRSVSCVNNCFHNYTFKLALILSFSGQFTTIHPMKFAKPNAVNHLQAVQTVELVLTWFSPRPTPDISSIGGFYSQSHTFNQMIRYVIPPSGRHFEVMLSSVYRNPRIITPWRDHGSLRLIRRVRSFQLFD